MVNQIFNLPLQSTRPGHGVRVISNGDEVVCIGMAMSVCLQIVGALLSAAAPPRLMCKHMQCLVIDIIIIAGS